MTTCVASFNCLAHAYTKYSAQHHGHTASGGLESPSQRDARYRLNQELLLSLDCDVLLLQEHDVDMPPIPGYTEFRNVLPGKTEGTSVLIRTTRLGFVPVSVNKLDLDHGKTATLVEYGEARDIVYVSAHLKGGPGSEPVQKLQMQTIMDALACGDAYFDRETMVVFGGDLNNTDPDGSGIVREWTEHGMFQHASNTAPTGWNSALTVPLTLDHVYIKYCSSEYLTYTPTATVVGTPTIPWLPDARNGSDHCPVVVKL